MATTAQATSRRAITLESTTRPYLSAAMLLASDLIALVLAGFFGMQVWMLVNASAPPLYLKLWPALIVFIVMFMAEGLYPAVGIGPVESLRKLVRGASLVYLVLSATLFLTKGSDLQSRGEFFSSWVLTILFLPLGRAVVHHYFARQPWFGVPIVILGGGRTALLLVDKLRSSPELALKPIACFDDDPAKIGEVNGVPVMGPLSMAASVARMGNARHAVIAMPNLPPGELADLLESCSAVFPHVLLIPNLAGLASIPVSPVDVGGILALKMRHNLLFAINRYLKRMLDVALVLIGVALALPVILIAAAWICIASPGNPFYLQEREGERGRALRILKLRTMYPHAESLLQEYLERNPLARLEWERHCKLKNDPRVLPGVGTFLRRSSLDELPQIWNILTGEMSLVGPRPFPRYHNSQFPEPFRSLRTKVRPGLTGLWQISERSEADLETQAALDTYYIRNWSLWLDVFILSRTVQAVIAGRGAY